MQDIKVSIITVCYNSEKTIERTIKSVLNQTYKNIEYIIIDGKSTDGTLDIVNKYRDQFGDNIKVVSEPDHGIYDAMNKGVRLATGTLVGIINSDDWYETFAVEKVVEAYNKNPQEMQVVYGAIKTWLDNREFKVMWNSIIDIDNMMIEHPGTFVGKAVYDKYGVYDTKYSLAADYELMMRYARQQDIIFTPLFEIIANFSEGGSSYSGAIKSATECADIRLAYGVINVRQYKKAVKAAIRDNGGPFIVRMYNKLPEPVKNIWRGIKR